MVLSMQKNYLIIKFYKYASLQYSLFRLSSTTSSFFIWTVSMLVHGTLFDFDGPTKKDAIEEIRYADQTKCDNDWNLFKILPKKTK